MDGSLFFKAEVPGSSLLGHLLKEFSLRLTLCTWLVGYYGTRNLVEVRVNWPGHPRYLKKKKVKMIICSYFKSKNEKNKKYIQATAVELSMDFGFVVLRFSFPFYLFNYAFLIPSEINSTSS